MSAQGVTSEFRVDEKSIQLDYRHSNGRDRRFGRFAPIHQAGYRSTMILLR
jgi:hypothetical protein